MLEDYLEVRPGRRPDLIRAVRSERPRLKRYAGELHDGWSWEILSGVFSTRMWIKQENFACQRLLETVAEPLDAFVAAAANS